MRISFKCITLAALALVSLTGCQGGMGTMAKNMWPGNWWTSSKKDPPSIADNNKLQPSQPPLASYGQTPSTLDGRTTNSGVALAGNTASSQQSQARVASTNTGTQTYGSAGYGTAGYNTYEAGIANPQSGVAQGSASQWGAQPSATNPAYGSQYGQQSYGAQPAGAMQQYQGPGAAQYPYPSTTNGQDAAWSQGTQSQGTQGQATQGGYYPTGQSSYGTQPQYQQSTQGTQGGTWDTGVSGASYNQGAATSTQGAGFDHTAAYNSGYSNQDYNSQWGGSTAGGGAATASSGDYRPGSTGNYASGSSTAASDPFAAPSGSSGTYR